jgi:hypothetical protein
LCDAIRRLRPRSNTAPDVFNTAGMMSAVFAICNTVAVGMRVPSLLRP